MCAQQAMERMKEKLPEKEPKAESNEDKWIHNLFGS